MAPWPLADGPELTEAPTWHPLAWALVLRNEIWNVYYQVRGRRPVSFLLQKMVLKGVSL